MTVHEALEALKTAQARSIQAERELVAVRALAKERQSAFDLALHYVELARITYEWASAREFE